MKRTPRTLIFLLILTLLLPLSACARLEEQFPPEAGAVIDLLQSLPAKLDDLAQRTQALADELEYLPEKLERWLTALITPPTQPPALPDRGSTFSVRFLDVGQADAALVECDGAYMLIDGGNREDSDLIYSCLTSSGVERLEYLVATHLHEDHIGGLSAAPYAVEIGTALAPENEGSTKVFKNLVTALGSQGVELTIPSPGDSFLLGSAQVDVLGPVKAYQDTNDTSLVLKVTYGQTSFLFTGDMERTAEADLVESGTDLSATVLKVGHHGSSSSTSYLFLREVLPQYAVISVGESNKYGHPEEAVLSRLSDAQASVYRTDLSGAITAVSDGLTVTITTER